MTSVGEGEELQIWVAGGNDGDGSGRSCDDQKRREGVDDGWKREIQSRSTTNKEERRDRWPRWSQICSNLEEEKRCRLMMAGGGDGRGRRGRRIEDLGCRRLEERMKMECLREMRKQRDGAWEMEMESAMREKKCSRFPCFEILPMF